MVLFFQSTASKYTGKPKEANGLIVGVVIGALCIFIVVAICIFLSIRKNKKQKKRMVNENNGGKYYIENLQIETG